MIFLQIIKKTFSLIKYVFNTPEQYARKNGVKIGDNCWIRTKNFGSEPYLIEIGNHVQITKNVNFLTHGGAWIFRNENPTLDFFGRIIVKDNVYIGMNSIILPGVTIDSNVIIAAGSVVTKSIPSNVIVGGNPAKVINNVDNFYSSVLKYNLNTKGLKEFEKREILSKIDNELFIKKEYLKIYE